MRIAILGGGLQGACVTMELARHGVVVELFDGEEHCLAKASSHNEGKIHLGYVYGNDPSLDTARTMLVGAIQFETLLRGWVGEPLDTVARSSPFHYLVHVDSILTPGEVENHLQATCKIAHQCSPDGALPYFGQNYLAHPERLSQRELESLYDPATVQAAFATPEIAIDTVEMAAVIRQRLGTDPNIILRMGTRIHGVTRAEDSAAVHYQSGDEQPAMEIYDHVVNTLWDGRLAVDCTAGIKATRTCILRLKYFVRVAMGDEPRIPSCTVVLGPFGDIVSYGNGEIYLSWYPACLKGVSTEITPPPWPLKLEGQEAETLLRETVRELARLCPGVAGLWEAVQSRGRLGGGAIVAWGKTDIDDRESGLHQRHAIGPQSWGHYHSVDTGKLTTAPLFGKQMADHILSLQD